MSENDTSLLMRVRYVTGMSRAELEAAARAGKLDEIAERFGLRRRHAPQVIIGIDPGCSGDTADLFYNLDNRAWSPSSGTST